MGERKGRKGGEEVKREKKIKNKKVILIPIFNETNFYASFFRIECFRAMIASIFMEVPQTDSKNDNSRKRAFILGHLSYQKVGTAIYVRMHPPNPLSAPQN